VEDKSDPADLPGSSPRHSLPLPRSLPQTRARPWLRRREARSHRPPPVFLACPCAPPCSATSPAPSGPGRGPLLRRPCLIFFVGPPPSIPSVAGLPRASPEPTCTATSRCELRSPLPLFPCSLHARGRRLAQGRTGRRGARRRRAPGNLLARCSCPLHSPRRVGLDQLLATLVGARQRRPRHHRMPPSAIVVAGADSGHPRRRALRHRTRRAPAVPTRLATAPGVPCGRNPRSPGLSAAPELAGALRWPR
jgi:hypothetical protein